MSEAALVGVIGAESLVGRPLVPLLSQTAGGVLACSRSAAVAAEPFRGGVHRHRTAAPLPVGSAGVSRWITLCPLWAVPAHLRWLEQLGAEHVVALSSMSGVTKADSSDSAERALATRLTAAEDRLVTWAADRGIGLTLLVPTMIYDGRNDANVAAIADWVRRFGWFPLCGPALGRRQPVHAEDVAAACLAASDRRPPRTRYTLSGGEALPFRDLVVRVCRAHGLRPRTVHLTPWIWHVAARFARGLGLAGGASGGMGRRMNEDLSCDHAAAAADLDFRPRPFDPAAHTIASDDGLVTTRPDRRRDNP
ncbi:MAG: SDR family oxidoreductase [Planctomycetota bacterium]